MKYYIQMISTLKTYVAIKRLLKILWQKKKQLMINNFSFCHTYAEIIWVKVLPTISLKYFFSKLDSVINLIDFIQIGVTTDTHTKVMHPFVIRENPGPPRYDTTNAPMLYNRSTPHLSLLFIVYLYGLSNLFTP